MGWDSWQRSHAPVAVAQEPVELDVPTVTADASPRDIKEVGFRLIQDKTVTVETDLFSAEISTVGGDLRHLSLLKHRADNSTDDNFVLMDDAKTSETLYVAQSGLIGQALPTHKALFSASAPSYQLAADQDVLKVVLNWTDVSGLSVDKIYTFTRGNYAIKVDYKISNGSAEAIDPWVYYQIIHDSQSNQGSRMMPTFTGGAYFTDADKFKKINFGDMAKSDFSKVTKDGWIGLVQHYFVGAWIPQEALTREFYTNKLTDTVFAVGTKSSLGLIAPGQTKEVSAQLFAGPQTHDDLVATAPGLEYTVDYGWLAFIASPLFKILDLIQDVVGNWGVAIILLTILIKLVFYPLSAAGYRNMAQMRELAPRLQSMKEKFGDDRQKMQQAMMELYKTEKINPLGGCLPILVQIPVFIGLYWMLLASVEMRHAPFMLWIQDLSAPDPYWVLPVLMGLSMIIQTKLNPKPTDPIQAKVMTWMPVVFSIFFFFFPAGLVLYWLVNNILSIVQQAYINRTIHAAALAKKGHAKR
jgi:YidC/Oxa1 family membrane protein insertase